jgi:hypothetical protein
MTALAIPNAATKTEGYTYAIPGANGLFYAPVDDACPTALLDGLTLIAATALIRDEETGEVVSIASS